MGKWPKIKHLFAAFHYNVAVQEAAILRLKTEGLSRCCHLNPHQLSPANMSEIFIKYYFPSIISKQNFSFYVTGNRIHLFFPPSASGTQVCYGFVLTFPPIRRQRAHYELLSLHILSPLT